jgi:hypothetical protein
VVVQPNDQLLEDCGQGHRQGQSLAEDGVLVVRDVVGGHLGAPALGLNVGVHTAKEISLDNILPEVDINFKGVGLATDLGRQDRLVVNISDDLLVEDDRLVLLASDTNGQLDVAPDSVEILVRVGQGHPLVLDGVALRRVEPE